MKKEVIVFVMNNCVGWFAENYNFLDAPSPNGIIEKQRKVIYGRIGELPSREAQGKINYASVFG